LVPLDLTHDEDDGAFDVPVVAGSIQLSVTASD